MTVVALPLAPPLRCREDIRAAGCTRSSESKTADVLPDAPGPPMRTDGAA